MKKYLSFFRIRFLTGLQYRTAAFAGICTQFAWGSMEVLMFKAFYEANPGSFPMTFQALSSYIWMQQAFLALFMPWFWDNEIFSCISDGNISYELCRPAGLYEMWFTKNLAIRFSKAVLRCLPILVVAAFLPEPYGMCLPAGALSTVLFFVSVILGAMTVVSFSMLIYISAFFTISSQGIKLVASTLAEFFSGAVIPLPFLPEGLQKVVELLPFASMQNAPLRIYSGDILPEAAWGVIGLQLFWLLTMYAAGKQMMRMALRQVTVQGG